MYTVYQHKNLRNGKSYIGMTSREPKKRWDSGWGYQRHPKMWKDIQNSDWNADWEHNILGKFEDKQEALKYEAFMIAMLGTVRNGYNTSSYGGTSYKRTDETKKKLSESHIGKHHSEETKRKISGANKGKVYAPIKAVLQFSKDGELIAEYSSIHEAERNTGCNNSHISSCCKDKRKSCGGYIWKYKEI